MRSSTILMKRELFVATLPNGPTPSPVPFPEMFTKGSELCNVTLRSLVRVRLELSPFHDEPFDVIAETSPPTDRKPDVVCCDSFPRSTRWQIGMGPVLRDVIWALWNSRDP